MQHPLINGIHHVTAMASAPQTNLEFYSGFLGLRLVKKTINFDAPDVYHLYYGDETGLPGSIMTFFPFGANPRRGQSGNGQAAITSFSVPMAAMDYWRNRFAQFEMAHQPIQTRFNEAVLAFQDPDGLGLEIVGNDLDLRVPFTYGHIPTEYSIRGFWGTELWETRYERTEALLTGHLGYEFIGESGVRRRYAPKKEGGNSRNLSFDRQVQNSNMDLNSAIQVGSSDVGKFVDILWDSNQKYGRGGIGTVHHIAFDTPTEGAQYEISDILLNNGFLPTDVMDRQYFKSIYFREPGGVLFEIATTTPGFLFDESVQDLGTGLKLPPWEERRRAAIQQHLLPISLEKALEKYR
jgi:glyoxalase family protein